MLKENKGVTLVALVITIIVLLILAGVTLSMVLGDSGIFGKANTASVETNLSNAKDAVRLALLEVVTDSYNNNGTVDSNKAITSTDKAIESVQAQLKSTGEGYTVLKDGNDGKAKVQKDNNDIKDANGNILKAKFEVTNGTTTVSFITEAAS